MSLRLIAPGKRIKRINGKDYPNRFFLLRGEIGSHVVEVSTKTADKRSAEKWRAEYEYRFLSGRVPSAGEEVTFAAATGFYIAFRSPSKGDAERIRRISAVIKKPVAEVQHADLVAAADRLYPGRTNETKNRWVMKPGAAILHYAATNKWCEWLRIEKLEEGPVRTRASDEQTARTILSALDDEEAKAPTPLKKWRARQKRLLILWLFKHGNRISDPLRLKWEDHIFLQRKAYLLFIGKANQWKEKPLDDEVFDALANEPDKIGRVFPWRSRASVYKWLRPLVRRLKVTFTPHMARHFVGKQLNAQGQGLKTIMGALDHSDAASSIRYQDADFKIVRAALQSAGKIRGKK